MTKLSRLKWIGVAALFVAGFAFAQVPSLFITSPTGLEQINVSVPSTGTIVTNPQISTITLNQIRNAEGYVTVAAGTTVNTTMPNTAVVAIATGAITTWNVTLPTAPYDGLMAKVTCPGGNVTTLAIAATLPTGVAIVQGAAITSCTASSNTDAAWIYSSSANTWYRTE